MIDRPDLVGVAEAARITGLSVRGVRKAHERGTMPSAIPVAGSDVLVWDRGSVEAWAEQRPGPGHPRKREQEA